MLSWEDCVGRTGRWDDQGGHDRERAGSCFAAVADQSDLCLAMQNIGTCTNPTDYRQDRQSDR